jgi:hypothetical protein
MDAVLVKDRDGRTVIGAVVFIDDQIVAIVAYFEDKDWDHSGDVDLKERFFSFFGLKGKALAEVASRAIEDPNIMMRDPAIRQWQGNLLTAFASTMIIEGLYKTYLSLPISRASGVIAGQITQSAIKSFVIKKGMEKAVEAAYKQATGVR